MDKGRAQAWKAKKVMNTDITSMSKSDILSKSEKAVSTAVKTFGKAEKAYESILMKDRASAAKNEAEKLTRALQVLRSVYNED